MKSNPNPNLIVVSERLRLYTEDPQLMIKRQIRKSFLIIILTLVITAGLIFYLTSRLNQQASILESRQNQLMTAIKNNTFNTHLQDNWQEVAPFETKIKAALPSADNLLDYQQALEQAAQAAGVQISVNFAPTQASTVSNLPGATRAAVAPKSMEHTVELKGSLSSCTLFLKNLENLPYFVEVSNFNLASQQGLAKDTTATLTLKVYTQ
jgi:Tfp pilus assembly protein PilO